MIWVKGDLVRYEPGEPSLRSCWECNSAHERLKKVNTVHLCLWCGRYWIGDTFLNTLDTVEKFVAGMSRMGFEVGKSTREKEIT